MFKLTRILRLNAIINTLKSKCRGRRDAPPFPYNIESYVERSIANVGFKRVQAAYNIARGRQNLVRRRYTIDRSLDDISIRF
jgi:hypothetical protein